MSGKGPGKRGLLVLTELFLPTRGGTAVWFDEVYRRLGGKEIQIVTADVPGAKEHDAENPNTIHRLALNRRWWLRPESLGMYIRLFTRSLKASVGKRIAAVHAGRVLPEGLVGLGLAKLLRVPLVVYAHGEEITTWTQPVKHRFMVFTYRNARRVIANSEFTELALVGLGVDPARIEKIYPGVDLERFQPGIDGHSLRREVGIGDEALLILSVGRLSRRKGFDRVVESLPNLVNRGLDVHYALVGIGEDQGFLQQLAGQLGVSERVHLLGSVTPEALPRWYNAAEVFAMPNRDVSGDTEGFGMVYLEAGACGVPSVTGLAGGTGSAVVDGETGLRVDGEDVAAVEGALYSLLADLQRREAMGEAALVRSRREFSWDVVADKTKRLQWQIEEEGGRRE